MGKWVLKRTKVNIDMMMEEFQIKRSTALALAHRNINERGAVRRFLYETDEPTKTIHDMKDGTLAVEILEKAVREQKKIAVYGDYDVDGVTSTTILVKTLRAVGGDVMYYIPDRHKEGYGLNEKAVELLHEKGVNLLMTCDNGIASIKEVSLAKTLGMEVVIIDHHEPGFIEKASGKEDVLPEADAIIDPKQSLCTYPFSLFCAAGLSYKFALALFDKMKDTLENTKELQEELLTFAAIGTVCDIVDLIDENRAIVRAGLSILKRSNNLGLQQLVEKNGASLPNIEEYHIGFVIGPCINAAGRLENGKEAVDLFLTEDIAEASPIAESLVALNTERKRLTLEGTERLLAKVESQEKDKILVLYDEETNESVAGIIAGRIKETYNHPTIVITKSGEFAKGSGRSIEGYDLFLGLFAHKELFLRFGGHPMAAGFSLEVENIDVLRNKLNADCTLEEDDFLPINRIDQILDFSDISMDLVEELRGLAPFGKGNPKSLFASTNIEVSRFSIIGKNKNVLKFALRDPISDVRISAISFDGLNSFIELLKELYNEEKCAILLETGKLDVCIDFVYTLDINTYNGASSVQLLIKDFRPSKQS
ncbi:MAG: single-stranded-DNA-specific exonuclease RecJ [Bacillota bacterium]